MLTQHPERIAHPLRYYSHPSSILADGDLTVEERITALKNWRDDINLRVVASEENMGSDPKDINLIADIDKLLSLLQQQKS